MLTIEDVRRQAAERQRRLIERKKQQGHVALRVMVPAAVRDALNQYRLKPPRRMTTEEAVILAICNLLGPEICKSLTDGTTSVTNTHKKLNKKEKAELQVEAKRLRADGLTYKEIANQLKISPSMAYNLAQ